MIQRIIFVFFASAVIWISFCLAPLNSISAVQKEITAAAIKSFPPEYSVDENGNPAGFAIDVMNEVARIAGLRVNYILVNSWNEMVEAVESGRADLIPNMGITDDRKKLFAFTSPVETFQVSIFVRSTTDNIHTDNDLAGHRVAVVKLNVGQRLLKDRTDLELAVFNDIERALMALLSGHVDALVFPSPVIMRIALEAGLEDRIKPAGVPLIEIKRATAVRRDNSALLDILEPAVKQFTGTSQYKKIYTKWYAHPVPFWTVRKVVMLMSGLLIGVISTMGLWRYYTLMTLNRKLHNTITLLKASERALSLSEDKFSRAFRSSPTYLSITSMSDGRFIDVNDSFLKAAGYRRDEIIGHTIAELRIWAEPEERTRIINLIRSHGAVLNQEIKIRMKSGDITTVLWSGETIDIENEPCIIAVALDITGRKQLEAQLMQAQKMEAVGQLAGGIAHDFNNILTAIINYSHILLKGLNDNEKAKENLNKIMLLSERAASITRGLLAFSRKQYFDFTPSKLNDIIRNVEKLLIKFISEDISVTINLTDKDPVIIADKTQIEQALMNLSTNARDSMPDGGNLIIETDVVEIDAAFIKEYGFGQLGTYALLSVTDTGAGMNEETRTRIFEPFFSTKEIGKGTGLGLAIVYGIVKQHNGYISVSSRPEHGTVFKIYLPQTRAAIEQTGDRATAILTGKGETVLLAEDDSAVRNSMKSILENYGYRVMEAASGDEAVNEIRQNTDIIMLLVLDIVMPGMSGKEVYEQVKRINPKLRVIFTSGYTADIIHRKKIIEEDIVFVSKPINPDIFLGKIRQVLDS